MKYKTKQRIYSISRGIFVFVIGSLVLTFLINGGWTKINNEIKSSFEVTPEPVLDKSNLLEVETPSYVSCSALTVTSKQNGITVRESKEMICTSICGQVHKKEYVTNECRLDSLYCYCER